MTVEGGGFTVKEFLDYVRIINKMDPVEFSRYEPEIKAMSSKGHSAEECARWLNEKLHP